MSDTYINLHTSRTAWVFLLAAANDVDTGDRHLLDLAWGLKNLTDSGIKNTDIFIYIDTKLSAENVNNHLNFNSFKYHINSLSEYFNSDSNIFNNYMNVMFFVLGHGSKTGLDSLHKTTPYELINKIKNMSGPRNAVLYLGQCYAGIFNYLKVSKDNQDVELIVIGATEFQSSLSYPIKDNLYSGVPTEWIANLFMYHLFKWFKNPIDVDGDNSFSILDSYKYTEIETSQLLSSISSLRLNLIGDLHGKRSNIQLILQSNPNIIQEQKDLLEVDIEAIDSLIQQQLTLLTNKQEGWLLNAHRSRDIGL